MKPYAQKFYSSQAWRATRDAYAKSVGYTCEECAKSGKVGVPGEIVHHIVPLTPTNIGDTRITLDWSNLEYVCRECHHKIHEDLFKARTLRRRRFEVDEFGRVSPRNDFVSSGLRTD